MSTMGFPSPIAWFSWRRWLIIRKWLERVWDPVLEKAIHGRDVGLAIRALANGANPNALLKGESLVDQPEPALVMAARKDDDAMIRALVHFGACTDASGGSMFQHDALATAVLGRKWRAARELVETGASWETPIWVLDPGSLSSAMALSGAVDPSLIRSFQTTLGDLVEGRVQSLRDKTLSKIPVSEDPRAKEMLEYHRSLRSRECMMKDLPPPESKPSSPSARF